jgi:hypothetical protein
MPSLLTDATKALQAQEKRDASDTIAIADTPIGVALWRLAVNRGAATEAIADMILEVMREQ